MAYTPTAEAVDEWHNEYSCVSSGDVPEGHACDGGSDWSCRWDHDGEYPPTVDANGVEHTVKYHFYICTWAGGSGGGSTGGGGTRPPSQTNNSFYLRYMDNQGSGGPGIDARESTEDYLEFPISSTEPVRKGYKFLGWSTDQFATKPQYKYDGSSSGLYDSIIVDAGTTQYLYAVWQEEAPNTPPTITGATDKTIHVGDKFDELEGVSASDKEDGDLTDVIRIDGFSVDTSRPGKYTLIYAVTDSGGLTFRVNRVITVQADMLKAMPSTGIPAVGLLPVIGVGLFGLGVMAKRKRAS